MTNELYHHGIIGMKWGVRRYQNRDGTLTAEGRDRYGSYGTSIAKGAGSKRAFTKKSVAKQIIKSNSLVDKQRSKEMVAEERSYKKSIRSTNRQFGKDSEEAHNLYAKHEERKSEIQDSYNEGKKAVGQFFKDRYGDRSFESALRYIETHKGMVSRVNMESIQAMGNLSLSSISDKEN